MSRRKQTNAPVRGILCGFGECRECLGYGHSLLHESIGVHRRNAENDLAAFQLLSIRQGDGCGGHFFDGRFEEQIDAPILEERLPRLEETGQWSSGNVESGVLVKAGEELPECIRAGICAVTPPTDEIDIALAFGAECACILLHRDVFAVVLVESVDKVIKGHFCDFRERHPLVPPFPINVVGCVRYLCKVCIPVCSDQTEHFLGVDVLGVHPWSMLHEAGSWKDPVCPSQDWVSFYQCNVAVE